MSKYTPTITDKERIQAAEALELCGAPSDVVDSELPAREVVCVLDAIADGEDPWDALEEYRMWRTPAGRREEAYYS